MCTTDKAHDTHSAGIEAYLRVLLMRKETMRAAGTLLTALTMAIENEVIPPTPANDAAWEKIEQGMHTIGEGARALLANI